MAQQSPIYLDRDKAGTTSPGPLWRVVAKPLLRYRWAACLAGHKHMTDTLPYRYHLRVEQTPQPYPARSCLVGHIRQVAFRRPASQDQRWRTTQSHLDRRKSEWRLGRAVGPADYFGGLEW